jgi:hypothetical protein
MLDVPETTPATAVRPRATTLKVLDNIMYKGIERFLKRKND